jgi:hypothetical protein
MAIRPVRGRTAAQARLAVYLGLGLATVAGLVAYGFYTLNAPPTWSDLPPDWFERPATQDPATWRLPGASELKLELRGVRLKIIPEDRQAASFSVEGAAHPLLLSPDAEGRIVLGGGRDARCPFTEIDNTQTIVVRTPRDVTIRTSGAFTAEVGPARSLMIADSGCGVWRVGGAPARLWIGQSGDGLVEAGTAGEVRVFSKGATVRLDRTTRSLDAVVRGPGRLQIGAAEGAINAQAWGRGRIDVASGFTSDARLFVKGPGRISHLGTIGALTAEARMHGKVKVAHVRGLASGSGDIDVAR